MAAINVTALILSRKIWVCEHVNKYERSKGVLLHDNPFTYTLPVLFLQTSLVSLLTTILQFILAPLGQSSFVPQMLVIYLIFSGIYVENKHFIN